MVGKYWQQRGYAWIHHDFRVFGENRDEMYLESQKILKQALGPERFSSARGLAAALRPFRAPGRAAFEQPDLLIYKPDMSEVRFAECKRPAVGDRLRPQQGIGLFLLGAILRCPVDVFIVAMDGDEVPGGPLEIRFPSDEPPFVTRASSRKRRRVG